MAISRMEAPDGQGLARALGWFSIGLGVAQIAAPRKLSRWIGVDEHPMLMRALGLREIAAGAGILSQSRPAGWLWGRVAGDAMDLTLLGGALRKANGLSDRVGTAFAAVAGVTALDVAAARQVSKARRALTGEVPVEHGIPVEESIAIALSPDECYRYWRDFANLARFMRHLESVEVRDEKRSHWVVKGPAGRKVSWDAEITDDRPNQLIAWRSLDGGDVETAGEVRFEPEPHGRGTIVRVRMAYRPPAGVAGAFVAKLFGEEPRLQVKDDLRRFKQILETGEIATTEGQPHGRRPLLARTFEAFERRRA